jgi:hypothetical protein
MVSFSLLQKCTAASRMLTYGAPDDAHDDDIHMAESTTMECMYRFCRAVVAVFGPDYMRTPNEEDIARNVTQKEAQGFLGKLASIDCMPLKMEELYVCLSEHVQRSHRRLQCGTRGCG